MRRLFTIAVACAALAACKTSKEDRCKRAWAHADSNLREMAKALGSEADLPTAEDRKRFMDMCTRLSDEAVACIDHPLGEGCDEILRQAEEAVPIEKVTLAWETRKVGGDRATARVPAGWQFEDMLGLGVWSPPEHARYGMSSYEVGDDCAGLCKPRTAAEWAKLVEDEYVADLRTEEDTTIRRDEKLGDTGRLVVAESRFAGSTQTRVMGLFWQEGGEVFYLCKADLDRELSANVDEFAQACKDLQVHSFRASVEDE